MALIWFAVDKGLTPLTQLAGDVKQRNAQDLGALTIDPVPEEVKPLVAALNIMFKRVERGLENERQFTGNAAHELRTPLAGLRVQAQVARNSTNDVQRLKALSQILAGADQAAHLEGSWT
jgi:two-component system sensor histidine kinase QseC